MDKYSITMHRFGAYVTKTVVRTSMIGRVGKIKQKVVCTDKNYFRNEGANLNRWKVPCCQTPFVMKSSFPTVTGAHLVGNLSRDEGLSPNRAGGLLTCR